MQGIDQSTGAYVKLVKLIWEHDEAGAKMDVDTKAFLNLKLPREDMGLPTSMLLPPTLVNPLRGVEQNMMQRPISVNVWDTEPSPLHHQHFEECERGQKVEWLDSTNRFSSATHGPTLGDFDLP